LKRGYQITVERPAATFHCSGDDVILRAGLRAGLELPYECNVGGCGSCKFDLLEGEVENLGGGAGGLSDRDRMRGRWLACQARPLGNCRIRMIGRSEGITTPRPRRFQATLTGMTELTRDLREFRFVSATASAFQPGQYAMLSIPGIAGQRAYSMSNVPNEQGRWDFVIRRVVNGTATRVLFGLPLGTCLQIDGPYGHAFLRTSVERDIVCVAGGSGLSPMLGIARGIDRAPVLSARNVHFFYGCRTAADVCGEALLRALPSIGGKLNFHAAVSGVDPAWRGRFGFIHELVEETVRENPSGFEYYMAGPPPMAEAVMAALRRQNVPLEQLHFDRFF
jgi:toluene monooxygenase electron transfer component